MHRRAVILGLLILVIAMLAMRMRIPSRGGGGAAVVVPNLSVALDLFTDTGGTGLDAHTMDQGNGWTEHTGAWTVQSTYAAQGTSGATRYIATADAALADARIHAIVKTSGTGSYTGGVVVRFADTSNYWMIDFDTTVSLVRLFEVNAGTFTLRDSTAWTPQKQQWIEFLVECDGNTISAWIDGGFSLSYTSTFNNSATRHGIIEYQGSGYSANQWDEFQIARLTDYPWTRQGTVLSATYASENSNVQEVTVIRESGAQILSGDVFKMWYIGGGLGYGSVGIYYAESTDGSSWTKYGDTRLITDLVHFDIIKVGSTYYAYGIEYTAGERMDRYSSSDGITWSLDTSGVLTIGASGQWDDTYLGNVTVWQEDTNDWRMLYEANDGSIWRMGYATSTNGTTWTKHGSNPVIGTYDGAGGASVFKSGSYYYAWGHTDLPSRIKRYRSVDLITWEPYPYGTIIPRVGSGEGESSYNGQVADFEIIVYNGTAYGYFEGTSTGLSSSGNMHIVLATADEAAVTGWLQ